MTALPEYAAWCATGLLLCMGLLLLKKPLAILFRVCLRWAAGLAALSVFSQFGHYIGISLGVNPLNALILGIRGAPGFALLLMLQWVLR